MEDRLIEAALTGSVDALREITSQDKLILDKVVVGCLSRSPLHTAASYGNNEFVKELLRHNPKLALVMDSADRTALHLVAAEGAERHVEVAKTIIDKVPEMCMARDRDGKTPLHVAAMYGKVDMLEVLVEANPHAARARVNQDETILHLCVKHNQIHALKKLLDLIDDKEFVNAKDSAGNTILHLAVMGKQSEIIKYVIEEKEIKVDAVNANGHTAMDILPIKKKKKKDDPNIEKMDDQSTKIEAYLQKGKAKTTKSLEQGEWVVKNKDALMVVASLIATIAFQAGVSPPGGVWQDDSDGHRAGEAVMAYHYPDSYPWYIRFSTAGFVASLSTILLLNSGLHLRKRRYMLALMMVMWLTITSTAASFAVAIVWVTPKKDRGSLTRTIVFAVIVFCSVMAILLMVHTGRLIGIIIREEVIFYKAIKKIKDLDSVIYYPPWMVIGWMKTLVNRRRNQRPIEGPTSV